MATTQMTSEEAENQCLQHLTLAAETQQEADILICWHDGDLSDAEIREAGYGHLLVDE